MKQELGPLQREWIEALRSGEFKQTTGCLFRTDGLKSGEVIPNCCLGVACIVAEANGMELKFSESGGRMYVEGYGSRLPDEVRYALNFHNDLGWLSSPLRIGDEQWTELADANDSGATFAQIADFAEANPEAVFTGPA